MSLFNAYGNPEDPLNDLACKIDSLVEEFLKENQPSVVEARAILHSLRPSLPISEYILRKQKETKKENRSKRHLGLINLDTLADFTWDFDKRFLLQVGEQYFVWLDPGHGGDNTITPYKGDPSSFSIDGGRGRPKGKYLIEEFCGPDVKFNLE